jgi:hypothetical protein
MIIRGVVGNFLQFSPRRDLEDLNSKMGGQDGLEPH